MIECLQDSKPDRFVVLMHGFPMFKGSLDECKQWLRSSGEASFMEIDPQDLVSSRSAIESGAV